MEHKVKRPRPSRTGASKISTKNQITLPVAVLERAHLRPGALVLVEADGPGRITVRSFEDELDRYAGSLPGVWPQGALDELRDEWR